MSSVGRLGPWCDAALRLLGWLTFAGVLAAGLHDASQAFDTWYYHLPFAARLAGIIPEDAFRFHPANEARYQGFALLGELLQGAVWRVTGRAECANLVAFSSVPLVAWFLWKRWGVPFAITLLALFAIPLVETHASSCYVDLPGNAAASVLVLLVIDAYATSTPVRGGDVALSLLMGAVAANIKPLLQPVVGLALLAILVRLVTREATGETQRRSRQLVRLMLFAAPLVLWTPLKNAVVHHNPFYPIGLHLFGHTLPGPEEAYASSPPWLADASRPVRFLSSVLEIGIRPVTDARRWTVDQWMPSDSTGNRMGGFFGAYVVVMLATLAVRVVRDRSRLTRVSTVVFLALTLLIACLPQSHELRYYMVWMIVLVTLNLGLACRGVSMPLLPGPRSLGGLAVIALAVVVASTRGAYVYPGGTTVADLVREKVDARALLGVRDGDLVCVRREPWNLLWSSYFHPPRQYRVQEAEDAADCGTVRQALSP